MNQHPEIRSRRVRGLRRGLVLLLALVVGAGATSAALAGPEPGLKGVVNVNTASSEELTLLPGIGESKARAILEERERRGRFERIEDLLGVKGIGESGLERIRPFVALEGQTTLAAE